MKTPLSIPQHDLCLHSDLSTTAESETIHEGFSKTNSPLAFDDTQILKTALTVILQKTESKYCFAAFIDTETAMLTNLFMATRQNFIAQRTDNTNFKKFWEDAFSKNESVIENSLPVHCTITCFDSSFRVLRYASIPTRFKKCTIIIILINKDTDYNKSDLLETSLVIKKLKSVFEQNQTINAFNDSSATDQSIPFFSERVTNSQRIESIGILSGGVAHDFNNYLTGILNFVNLAKLCTVSKQIEQYIDNTIAIVNEAQKLTKHFLRYSSNSEPSDTIIRVDKILRENISILLSGTNIRAELHVTDDLWLCEVDGNQIGQLFGNIIINARESMPDGGFIDISIHNEDIRNTGCLPLPAGKYIRIQIRDNGGGIPSEIQDHIFSPYFTTKPKRSGLGLTCAMMIAKKHKGYITMSSEINSGSVFTIYLPSADTLKSNALMQEDKKNNGKILLMDDEYYIRQTASEILKKKNFDVTTATQGRETVELFKNAHSSDDPFDVVILDLTIPDGLGGVETLKKLLEINPNVKAIASSGYSDDPVISQPEKYGFAGSLGKPYNLNEFINLIKNVIFRNLDKEHF